MSKKLTQEQENILSKIEISKGKFLGIQACAGSGKTFILKEIVKKLQPKTALYTAFNKAIILESKEEFTDNVDCRTVHSLAYKYTPSKKVGNLTTYGMDKKFIYEEKQLIIDTVNDFYLSDSVNMDNYFKSHLSVSNEDGSVSKKCIKIIETATKIVEDMLNGDRDITFNFMLKYLHLALRDKIVTVKYDLLLVDECQDMFPVSKEIFKLIQADYKIFAGDIYQDCYNDFMNTINAFKELPMDMMTVSKSFRCSKDVAERVEKYGQEYISKKFLFKGTNNPKTNRQQIMYISKTNTMTITRMQNLNKLNLAYRCIRKIEDIFQVALEVGTLMYGGFVKGNKYIELLKSYKKYREKKPKIEKLDSYILKRTEFQYLVATVLLLRAIPFYELEKLKEIAIRNMKIPSNIILTTAHSSKGLETDNVYIEDDLNNHIIELKENLRQVKEEDKMKFLETHNQSFNLGYIAVSRAKFKVINCRYL